MEILWNSGEISVLCTVKIADIFNAENWKNNVFLFKETGSCKKIPVKKDGIDVETIDQVINQQSQKSFDITGW